MEVEITVRINGVEYTMDEARNIYNELKKLFDDTHLPLTIPTYPPGIPFGPSTTPILNPLMYNTIGDTVYEK